MTRDPSADREIHSWLTDMDGVLVHEGHALPGAVDFVRACATPAARSSS